MWSFKTFLMENLSLRFEKTVYHQIVGIPMGTHCNALKAALFLYCHGRDFMSHLHKSKRYDLIGMFNNTSDVLTVYSPSITLNLRNINDIYSIYPTGLPLHKANTSDKDISFLDLNIKFIGSCVHTSVYDMTSDFLSSVSPGWVAMFLNSHRTVYILSNKRNAPNIKYWIIDSYLPRKIRWVSM